MKQRQMISVGRMTSAAMALLLAGCWSWIPSVGPDYERVEVDMPDVTFPDLGYEPGDTNVLDVVCLSPNSAERWWERFGCPDLNALLSEGVTNSLTFQIARNRHEQARWTYLSTWAAYMPNPTVSGSWSYNELRHNNVSMVNNQYSDHWYYDATTVGIGGSWQIDVFGGSRRSSEAGWALYEAEWETVRGTWLRLTADVASACVLLAAERERACVLTREERAETELLGRLKTRPRTDRIAYAEKRLEAMRAETRAERASAIARGAAAENAIAVLLGATPGSLGAALASITNVPSVSEQSLSDIPLETMRARPDVLKADRELAEKIAKVGVARALWYPKFYLIGSVGVQSTDIAKLFMADSLMTTLGPSIEWPIFHVARILSMQKLYELRVREAAMNYEQTLKRAVAEVRSAYAAHQAASVRAQASRVSEEASRAAVAIAVTLALADDGNLESAVSARAQARLAAMNAVRARQEMATSAIVLFKSLGGGLCTK